MTVRTHVSASRRSTRSSDDSRSGTHVTARIAPQAACGDCGHTLPAAGGGKGMLYDLDKLYCPACGSYGVSLSRDGVPYSVWLTLADNEDARGRVPAEAGFLQP